LACETAAALGSEAWLSVSLITVEQFLRMDCLDVGEAALVRALLRWGKFQLQKDGDDPNDGQKLRTKILPGLHLIRFAAMSPVEFIQLCSDGLGDVLIGDEKFSIITVIDTEDLQQMPVQIAPVQLAMRQIPHTVFALQSNALLQSGIRSNEFAFELDKNATMVGLAVKGSNLFLKNLSISLAVTRTDGRRRIHGFSQGTFAQEGNEFFRVTPNVDLDANTLYTLTFSGASPSTCTYSYPNYRKPVTNDWLTLTIGTARNDVNLQQIVFKQTPWNLKSWPYRLFRRCFDEVKIQLTLLFRRT